MKWCLTLVFYFKSCCRPSQNSAKTRKSRAQLSTRERTKISVNLEILSVLKKKRRVMTVDSYDSINANLHLKFTFVVYFA